MRAAKCIIMAKGVSLLGTYAARHRFLHAANEELSGSHTLNRRLSFLSWIRGDGNSNSPKAVPAPSTRESFGQQWQDPFRWMETNPHKLWRYLQSEQQHYDQFVTENLLDLRKQVAEDANTKLAKIPKERLYETIGKYRYFTHTSEERPDDHYMRIDTEKQTMQSVLDVNTILEEENAQLEIGQLKISPSQQLVLYTVNTNEQSKAVVMDISAGAQVECLRQQIHSLEWLNDEKSYLYSTAADNIRPSKIFRHKIGSSKPDELLLEENDEQRFLSLTKSKDSRFVFICSNSKIASEVHYVDANETGSAPVLIQPQVPGVEYYVEHWRDQFLILTNSGERCNRLMTAQVAAPERSSWQMLVPERPEVAIEDLDVMQDFVVLWERRDGRAAFSILCSKEHSSKIRISGHEEFFSQQSVTSFGDVAVHSFAQHTEQGSMQISLMANADFNAPSVSFKMSSPIKPEVLVNLQVSFNEEPNQAQAIKRKRSSSHDEGYSCWMEFCTSPDGTKVPMTVARNKRVRASGACLLECYGAYGTNLNISYNPFRAALMDRGWSVAYAHVRGGGEQGRSWHHAGRQQHKLSALQDLEACATHLQSIEAAQKGRIALHATSAGSVLAATTCLTQPEAFGALVLRMPFLDLYTAMMDSQAVLTQHEWDEWGDPRQPGGCQLLQTLCPYQALQRDTKKAAQMPPTLITCGAQDERVPVWMPAKWVAALRNLQGSHKAHPAVYLNLEDGGHFLDDSRIRRLSSIECAFLLHYLGQQ